MSDTNKNNKKIEIFRPDLTNSMEFPLVEDGLQAGFPSPAADYLDLKLDLNQELINNPNSTFFGRVKGNSMTDAGICDGDVLIIDKSITPQNDSIAVCFIDGEFTVKRIKIEKQAIYLIPENKTFKEIKVTPDNNFIIWGIVTYVIKKL